MTSKNIAIIALISTLFTSVPCSAEKGNPITAMIYNNVTRARNWASNFITKCQSIGVITTLYANLGMFNFTRMTGLDEEKLDTYNSQEIQKGIHRINEIGKYYPNAEDKLEAIFKTLNMYYTRAHAQENPNFELQQQ